MLSAEGGNTTSMNANSKLVVQRWQDETALSRFKMIAPLCDGAIDPAKRVQLRREIASANDLSYKTIKRYDEAYQSRGFEGLKPKNRLSRDSGKLPENFEELLQEAIQLTGSRPGYSNALHCSAACMRPDLEVRTLRFIKRHRRVPPSASVNRIG